MSVATSESGVDRRSGLVSVIVPVHNRPVALGEAVASALDQEGVDVEVIVVDDASTDDTPAAARALAASAAERVRVVALERNCGPGRARERGRRIARGEFLNYLDSDDLLAPGKLARQVAALASHPECGVAYGICRELHADGTPSARPLRPSDRALERMFPTFLVERWWNTLVPLYRAALCDRVGAWSELRIEEDWEYDARVAALALPLAFVPEVVALQRNFAPDRLSAKGADPARLGDRARARASILASARRTGIGVDTPEMAHCARSLFLLSRQCAAAGLFGEARELFALARGASTATRANGADFRLFALLARGFGWKLAARAGELFDRVRGGRRATSLAASGRSS